MYKHSTSLNVYIPLYNMINMYVSYKLAAWQILLITKKQKMQQSTTMSEITHHNDDNGDDEFN